MRLWVGILGGTLFSLGCAGSQASPERQPAIPPDGRVVRLKVQVLPTLAPGGHDEIVVGFSILPGFHVMSDRPSKPNYIPTALVFDAGNPTDIVLDDPHYPPPIPFVLADETIRTFQSEGTIRVSLNVAHDAVAADRALKGMLRYQACTERGCLFPRSEPFVVPIRIQMAQ